jgi:hypothetical protein
VKATNPRIAAALVSVLGLPLVAFPGQARAQETEPETDHTETAAPDVEATPDAPEPASAPQPESDAPPETKTGIAAEGESAEADSDDDFGAFEINRAFAGSVQLDYLSVPTERYPRDQVLDGATVEISLKAVIDFPGATSASVKLCIACHGLEVGMGLFDIQVADELNVRIGRFTPTFGDFPLRHDPANHRTSDKPLPYDMGRMLRIREWNMSVLPAPWVDNGVEVSGRHFFTPGAEINYALYAVAGPRAGSEALDFDFIESRTPYYIDNNSVPSVGGKLGFRLSFGEAASLSSGASAFAGHYDPERELGFVIAGVDAVLRILRLQLRAEYLIRYTEMALGPDPDSTFRYEFASATDPDNYFLKEGWYTEAEVGLGPLDLIARWDGLRRRGNVPLASPLRADSLLMRYTGGFAVRVSQALRLKVSGEFYDFSDFEDEVALHVAVAGAL